MEQRTCSIEGCEKTFRSRGWCPMHYERWRRHGDPLTLFVVQDGRKKHPLYKTWHTMVYRCTVSTFSGWEKYGGRGISVCQRWLDSFWDFAADMGERPEGRTLDRIDNDGNYEPSNCKWSTAQEQALNRRPRRRKLA